MPSQLTCYANCAKIVTILLECLLYCVSILRFIKFSFMYYHYFILALLPGSGE